MAHKMILSISADAKTSKGEKLGYITGILYLAPSTISGYQTCPMAKLAGCEAACLYSAGRGGFNSVQRARIAKTVRLFEQRTEFMRDLAVSVSRLILAGMYAGSIPLIRLNGTSDIRFENVPVSIDGLTAKTIRKICGFDIPVGDYSNIMGVFPEIQFYDYTKIPNRRGLPANYDLTFSYSGVISFERHTRRAIESGARVAAVFRRRADIPAEFQGLRTIDGDDTDVRHIEPRGVIVALYAKGAARRDVSGFVVDAV
mgnify:CR=1 FL=1